MDDCTYERDLRWMTQLVFNEYMRQGILPVVYGSTSVKKDDCTLSNEQLEIKE